jgi:hypothetical protein
MPIENLYFFYGDIRSSSGYGPPSADDFKQVIDNLEPADKRAFLLTPLSGIARDNALTHIISGSAIRMNDDSWRPDFLNVLLDAIEEQTQDRNERLAMLTGENELGQTPFLKMVDEYDRSHPETFDALTNRLYKWGGKDFADEWLKDFLKQPLGEFNGSASFALQGIGNRQQNGPDRNRLLNLSVNSYKPAQHAALIETIKKVHPFMEEQVKKNELYPEYQKPLEELAANPDQAVKVAGTILDFASGELFWKLLDLQQKFAPKTPEQIVDFFFERFSKADKDGNTEMHTRWQCSTLRGPPSDAGDVEDQLGPFLADLDKHLGEPAAIDLTKKLMLLQNDEGKLPLDEFEYNEKPQRDYYIESFLTSLRKELGSQQKFETYVREIVAAILPTDFTIKLSSYDVPEIDPGTGQPKIRRGAKIEP